MRISKVIPKGRDFLKQLSIQNLEWILWKETKKTRADPVK